MTPRVESCPSENLLAEHAMGGPGEEEVEAHLDGCPACRATVARLMSLASGAPGGSEATLPLDDEEPAAMLAPSTRVGRYVVIDVVGRGAMGTVYAAYDPELDRKIALKVLNADLGAGRQAAALRERLVREARVMARLSHPEVITVHDAGTFGEQVFIAMEFVGGGTLGAFLASKPRPLAEILDLFQRAGRGLAAAHAAGLVHRDFKPENVLVGAGGRVQVTDFGLARAEDLGLPPIDEAPASARPEPADAHLTATGAIVGTPAYMAPEQHRGERADARSDQFSFCVALYRALYGEPPFAAPTVAGLAEEIARGRVREPPRENRVPPWVRRVLLRGLSAVPEARYPSMDALLADLGRDPASKRWKVLLGAAVALLVGGAAASGWAMGAFRDPCAHPEQELAGVWDEGVKGRVREALLGTGRPYAADTVTRVLSRLDAYGASWAAMRGEVCRASRGDKQRREILGLRDACLDRRRGQLQALASVLAEKPDPKVLDKAVQAAADLAPISYCADTEALTARVRPPEDPAARARVDALQPRVDRLEALYKAGKYKDGVALGAALLVEAEAAGYAPLRAQVQYWMGELRDEGGEYDQAATLYRAAATSAAEGKDDLLAAASWAELLFVVGARQAHHEEASVIRALGPTALARVQDPRTRAMWLRSEGTLLDRLARYPEARAVDEQAAALFEKALGPDHPDLDAVLNNLAIVLWRMGDLPLSLSTHQRVLAIRERTVGPAHPRVATSLNNGALVLFAMGEYQRAKGLHERALAIREDSFGPESTVVAASLTNLGDTMLEMGELKAAVATYERALTILEKAQRPASMALEGLGRVDVRLGRLEAAAPLLERALAEIERVLGSAHPNLAGPLLGLGELALARGRPDLAAPLLERALGVANTEFKNDARLTLAEALWRLGKDRPRARKLAGETLADDQRIGHRPRIDRATRWLREHPDRT